MFLTESYVENTVVSADPTYAMQIMQEATDDWNDICMKMIKLEHTAIMREDVELLAEGAKEALHRFKNNVVVLGKKLIEYLERVRVQWSKLQASIATKILNPDKIKAILETVKYKENAKVMIPQSFLQSAVVVEQMSKCVTSVTDYVTKNGKTVNGQFMGLAGELESNRKGKSLKGYDESENEAIKRILKNTHFEEYDEEGEVTITRELINAAIEFLKKRPIAIKNIEIMKKAVTQVQNAVISELDKTDKPQSRNDLVILQSAFNKVIIKINKSTTYAVKICNAVKPNKETGVTAKDYNKGADNYRSMKGAWVEKKDNRKQSLKESVLDLF